MSVTNETSENQKSIRARAWLVTVHEKSMKKAGLSEEEYRKSEIVANTFVSIWENSGKERKAAAVVAVSADGCYHMHMACYGNTTTLNNVSTILFNSHVDPVRGTKDQLRSYLLKEPPYDEKGEKVLYSINIDAIESNQGKRTDLQIISEMLSEGKNPNEIFEESLSFRRFERIIRSEFLAIRRRSVPRFKNMNNVYHVGKSGSGKSYSYIKLCEEFGVDNVYLCSDYSNSSGSGGGFDNYSETAADILFLDELRGSDIGYSSLLNILDNYSDKQIHCRYANVWALWTSVHISSIQPPEDLYDEMMGYDSKRKLRDPYEQLKRRIHTIVYHFYKDNGFHEFRMPMKYYNGYYDLIKTAGKYYDLEKAKEALKTDTSESVQNKVFDYEKILAEEKKIEEKIQEDSINNSLKKLSPEDILEKFGGDSVKDKK